MPFIYALDRFVHVGWLTERDANVLNVIRACHPLLFALVLKRTLRNGPHRLSDAVFNTPAIFFAAA